MEILIYIGEFEFFFYKTFSIYIRYYNGHDRKLLSLSMANLIEKQNKSIEFNQMNHIYNIEFDLLFRYLIIQQNEIHDKNIIFFQF